MQEPDDIIANLHSASEFSPPIPYNPTSQLGEDEFAIATFAQRNPLSFYGKNIVVIILFKTVIM